LAGGVTGFTGTSSWFSQENLQSNIKISAVSVKGHPEALAEWGRKP